ncbi:hypothetical protein B7R54_05800 [Subtercola boreus]|uniref:DUF1211 domain-containing membrane protein n=1 Tax=Subtercola boreus TaxID=120213 RepID=A0A3E0VGM9_9MICO|nr:TMEM175 family protein [Subtercola boreus]RFA08795.1 hypothetical protein B7R54_05800 [Subtercola boreus]TQL54242.1 putative membrane protein [Subtercola boreus]
MGEVNDRYRGILKSVGNTERLQYFSDAVFAIALTLLVLEIALPEIQDPTNLTINEGLLDLWPKFLAYALSFGVIAINWAGHHRKFAVTTGFDAGVVWIDLLLLFLIAFLPFPTSLLSDYPGYVTPVILYAAIVSAISLVQFWLWSYAYRKSFLDERIDRSIYRMVRADLLVVPVVFIVSIPIALLPFDWAAFAAMYFWIVTWPANIVIGRLRARTSA